jgi:hypothetical protein
MPGQVTTRCAADCRQRDEIKAISKHQVVAIAAKRVCKTTQPKIQSELGRRARFDRFIPSPLQGAQRGYLRRKNGTPLGELSATALEIRATERSLIKLMTDGILLA